MKPLDPRLLRYARAARGVFAFGGLLGVVRTLAIIAWSWLLAHAIAAVAVPAFAAAGIAGDGAAGWSGGSGRVAEGALPLESLPWILSGALLAVAVRAISGWAMELLAARGAVRAKSQLRAAALDRLDAAAPGGGEGRSSVGLATTLGRGLDALDGYFSGYVPQFVLAVVATPILVATVLLADPVSGITVLLVFPVIPLFMILIGLATQAVQKRQWAQLQRLSTSFLDVVEGLSTLKIFGREKRQVERIVRETEEYRSRTMKVLRVTFLSGFVLDLAGTFSIALVAVTVGTRLVAGEFPLALGLFVLLLLPETFVPIRQVGAAFHASTEGLAASEEVFELIEQVPAPRDSEPRASAPRASEPRDARGLVTSRGNSAAEPTSTGNWAAAAAASGEHGSLVFDEAILLRGGQRIGPVAFEVSPGEFVALAGPSGSGKSSLLAALLGFAELESGILTRPEALSWAGQKPGLVHGSVAENVALGERTPRLEEVSRTLCLVGLAELDPGLMLGAGGSGLSGGQAQRVAIARCLYRAQRYPGCPLLLDEPTAALDEANERALIKVLRAEAREGGRAVLVVSHRPAVLGAADLVVTLGAPSTRAERAVSEAGA